MSSYDDHLRYTRNVWLIYAPNAEWSGVEPPKAAFAMHQLEDLMGRDDFPFLTAPACRSKVDKQVRRAAQKPSVP